MLLDVKQQKDVAAGNLNNLTWFTHHYQPEASRQTGRNAAGFTILKAQIPFDPGVIASNLGTLELENVTQFVQNADSTRVAEAEKGAKKSGEYAIIKENMLEIAGERNLRRLAEAGVTFPGSQYAASKTAPSWVSR